MFCWWCFWCGVYVAGDGDAEKGSFCEEHGYFFLHLPSLASASSLYLIPSFPVPLPTGNALAICLRACFLSSLLPAFCLPVCIPSFLASFVPAFLCSFLPVAFAAKNSLGLLAFLYFKKNQKVYAHQLALCLTCRDLVGSTSNRSEQTASTPLRRKTYSRPVGNKAQTMRQQQ